MRYWGFILLIGCFAMCKSKEKVVIQEPLKFVVSLEQNRTPKELQKELNSQIASSDKIKDKGNLFRLAFNEPLEKKVTVRKALLNHPYVISVFTEEEYTRINTDKSKDGNDAFNSKKESKQ